MVLLEPQGDLGRHHEHAPVRQRAGGRLERGLDSDDGDVRIGGAQRGGGDGGCRVAGDDDGLGAVGQQVLDDAARELEHLLLGLLAVRGVGGVAEEAEVLVRKLGDERAQHADAAHARVEDPHKTVALLAHVTLLLG